MGKLAYLFPGQGQGTIEVGMGKDIWEKSDNARRVFYEANVHLGKHFSDICFFGPEGKLLKTSNAQLASLIVNLAYVAAMSELGDNLEFLPREKKPAYLAGHSVGYVAALVFAGVISFQQALYIVKKRAELMTEACKLNPGRMIVLINPKVEEVERLWQDFGLGGNFNSEGQIVLSGQIEAIDKAEAEIRQKKLARKIVSLKTEGAFHSDCMKPAQEPFREFLESFPFAKPQIKIIGNSRAQIITTAQEAKEELVNQLCLPVLWHQSMKVLRQEGVTTFIEMGQGEVLSKIIKYGLVGGTVVAVSFSAALAAYLVKRSQEKKS